MTIDPRHLTLQKLGVNDPIPYELLLLADPSEKMIDKYLEFSEIIIAKWKEEIVGVIALLPLTTESVEIINVAIKHQYHGQGIGSYLIEYVVQKAQVNRQKSICIGTANSSITQLYLYQKLGFEISEIRKDYFTDNYAEPIFENGIQAKHMLVSIR